MQVLMLKVTMDGGRTAYIAVDKVSAVVERPPGGCNVYLTGENEPWAVQATPDAILTAMQAIVA